MPERRRKNKKVIRYRKPFQINIGMFIFGFIFIYMAIYVYLYATKTHVKVYEVLAGSIVDDKEYQGIILRQEEVCYTDRAGTISYYIRDGKKASVGSTVYAIDETGKMTEILASSQEGSNSISKEGIGELKKQLSTLSLSYSDDNFSKVYSAKYSLESSVTEYVAFNVLENMNDLLKTQGIVFQQFSAPKSGIVSFSIDQMESLTPEEINKELFHNENYQKTYLKAGETIGSESPAYKLVTSDNWSVVFPLDEQDLTDYQEKTSLKIKFLEQDLSVYATFSMFAGQDGAMYGKLDFNKYMVRFLTDRYVKFEIDREIPEGLKIPVSAITTKTFYTVPREYFFKGGNSGREGVNKKIFNENGEATVMFIPLEIYYSTDELYYIESSEEVTAGTILLKPDSNEEYQVSETAVLNGVYNINKGYAVFKQIQELDSNEEYCVVQKNMDYGLTIFDHIVLDGTQVDENDRIH